MYTTLHYNLYTCFTTIIFYYKEHKCVYYDVIFLKNWNKRHCLMEFHQVLASTRDSDKEDEGCGNSLPRENVEEAGGIVLE